MGFRAWSLWFRGKGRGLGFGFGWGASFGGWDNNSRNIPNYMTTCRKLYRMKDSFGFRESSNLWDPCESMLEPDEAQ